MLQDIINYENRNKIQNHLAADGSFFRLRISSHYVAMQ